MTREDRVYDLLYISGFLNSIEKDTAPLFY